MQSNDLANLHIELKENLAQGELDKAISNIQRGLSIEPDNTLLLELWATIDIQKYGAEGQAETLFKRVLEIDPDNHGVHNNLGSLYWQRGDLGQAKHSFSTAIAHGSKKIRPFINLANIHVNLKEYEQAIDVLKRCVKIKPEAIKAWLQLAWILELTESYDEALKIYDQMLRLKPSNPRTKFSRSLLLLKLGDYSQGWPGYEWRFYRKKNQHLKLPCLKAPEWNGEDLNGKTLLIMEEQGFGDAIQMVRYMPILKGLGANIILRCRPRLIKLFENVEGIDHIRNSLYNIDRAKYSFDYHIPIMSLPRVLGTEVNSIPNKIPYIKPNPAHSTPNSQLIKNEAFNVGLVWKGNDHQQNNDRRSCRLNDYGPLTSVSGIQLYSLQKGDDDHQLNKLAERMNIIDLMPNIEGFAETAHLIAGLDLVITIDTSVAHLAGAMGRPVWVILGENHCWRYSKNELTSPWYPHTKLFRKKYYEDWQPVIQSVAHELQNEVNKQ